jgi:arabinose-5-phosphate isomerase
MESEIIVGAATNVIRLEAEAIKGLIDKIDKRFVGAAEMILNSKGRVVITGVGKSGHIGQKIAATLASTGTPAFFVHAVEAFHGDLGMILKDDVVIAISYSGETAEVVNLLPHIKGIGAKIIALTGRVGSTLAKNSDEVLDIGVRSETDPKGERRKAKGEEKKARRAEGGIIDLAPTSSSIATLALGDALAIALATVRGFAAKDFAKFHPGGSLGKRLEGRK